ncbi:hypothetical protein MK489_19040 [Myxococcota bacterium]|nr:hypothetical protein [Myxococcota bacterium]
MSDDQEVKHEVLRNCLSNEPSTFRLHHRSRLIANDGLKKYSDLTTLLRPIAKVNAGREIFGRWLENESIKDKQIGTPVSTLFSVELARETGELRSPSDRKSTIQRGSN